MGTHNFFSHTGSDGLSAGPRITQHGYASHSWVDNIAADKTIAEATVQAWLDNPGHCRNIMNFNMVHVGVAHAI
ncbi:MAG: CAP domain-containing protein [Thioalkalivibrio sp.]|nr:CAP domain-containing protein [Thioalkalivibrio sp.]